MNLLRIDYDPNKLGQDMRRKLEGMFHEIATPDKHVETSLALMMFEINDKLDFIQLDVDNWANPRDFTLLLDRLREYEEDPDLLGFLAALTEAVDEGRNWSPND